MGSRTSNIDHHRSVEPLAMGKTLSATAPYAHLCLLGLQCNLLLQQDHTLLSKEARLVGLPLPPCGNSWCQVIPLILQAAGTTRKDVSLPAKLLTQLLSCANAASGLTHGGQARYL